jgi:hypothetical protein
VLCTYKLFMVLVDWPSVQAYLASREIEEFGHGWVGGEEASGMVSK